MTPAEKASNEAIDRRIEELAAKERALFLERVRSEVTERLANLQPLIANLRDGFAKAALQGLLHDTDERDRQHAPMAHQEHLVIAREAYALADAMMAARSETP